MQQHIINATKDKPMSRTRRFFISLFRRRVNVISKSVINRMTIMPNNMVSIGSNVVLTEYVWIDRQWWTTCKNMFTGKKKITGVAQPTTPDNNNESINIQGLRIGKTYSEHQFQHHQEEENK